MLPVGDVTRESSSGYLKCCLTPCLPWYFCGYLSLKVLSIFQPTAIEVDPIAQSKRPNRSSARDQNFGKLRHNHSHQDDKGQKEKIDEDKGSLAGQTFPSLRRTLKPQFKIFKIFGPPRLPPAPLGIDRKRDYFAWHFRESPTHAACVLRGAVNGREPAGRGTRARAHHTRAEARARDRIGKRPCRSRRTSSSSSSSRRPKEVRVPSQMPVACVTAFV